MKKKIKIPFRSIDKIFRKFYVLGMNDELEFVD